MHAVKSRDDQSEQRGGWTLPPKPAVPAASSIRYAQKKIRQGSTVHATGRAAGEEKVPKRRQR